MTDDVSRETAVLQDHYAGFPVLAGYAEILATDGVERGLIGPREVDRIWPRHLANCAVVALDPIVGIPPECEVVDVGSGAGLPGVVWAVVRPDLAVTLVEPLLRRSTFLTEVVSRLGLSDRVTVIRARAEEVGQHFDVVTARAVAPLDRLCQWTLPLCRVGGKLVAMKGTGAAGELAQAAPVIARLGGGRASVLSVGDSDRGTATVVTVSREASGQARRRVRGAH